jgi:hypothetical protein
MTEAVTPETAAVDAPVSMDSIIEEIATGSPGESDELSSVVEELEGGQAEETAEQEDEATEAVETDEETAEEEPEAEVEQPEPTYKVKVNGEEVEVPLPELLKSYSREQDYTKKTMALADERNQLKSQFASELKQQIELFESLDPILSEAKNIDWQALAASDPATYVQLQEAVKQRQAAIEQARAKVAEASQGDTAAETARIAEEAAKETEALIKAMPELADPEKLKGFATESVNYLRGSGFDDSEIAELIDHRALTIIDKARRFDAIEKAKTELPAKKVVAKPKAKSLKSDNSDSSRPVKRLASNASLDARVNHVLNELIQGS